MESEYYCECKTHGNAKFYPRYASQGDKELCEKNHGVCYIWHECADKAPAGMVYRRKNKCWGRFVKLDPIIADNWAVW